MIENLIEQSKSDKLLKECTSQVQIEELKTALRQLFAYSHNPCVILFQTALFCIRTNKTTLKQILLNLICNAIKYNDNPISEIEIGLAENEHEYRFYVKDKRPRHFGRI